MVKINTTLFHGMRSKKTAEQLKKEGFCSSGSPVDMKKAVVEALKYFGKEHILHSHSNKSDCIKSQIRQITGRASTYATLSKEAPCEWWARANPENITLALGYAGISNKDINKYLEEKYGKNCYRIELNLDLNNEERRNLDYNHINFNTNRKCIKPSEITEIRRCRNCNYTNRSIECNI